MSENMWIAIIGAVASIVGSYSLVNYRLNKLEIKVDKHNNYSDKIASLDKSIGVIQTDISYIKKAIDKLGK